MAITTQTLTGTLVYPDGTNPSSATVSAKRLQGAAQGSVFATADTYSASTNSSGVFSLSIGRNNTLVPAIYKVTLPDGKFFYWVVGPNQASADVGTIQVYSTPAPFFERDVTSVVMLNRGARLPVVTSPVTIATTSTTDQYIQAPSDGLLISANFTSLAALATSDTNFITWTITNLGQAGAGSAVMLAATDPNTTKATGGSALVANANRSLTLNGTVANLVVVKGDVIRCRATATGTLAGTVTNAQYQLQFGI